MNQSLGQWRDKVHSLEKTNCDTRNLISILEDDIRAGRKEYEALKNRMEKLKTERHQVFTVHGEVKRFGACAQLIDKRERQVCPLVRFAIHSFPFSSTAAVGADEGAGAGDIPTERRKRRAYWAA